MSFLAGFFGMNFFSANLAFQTPLPRGLLFAITCLTVVASPPIMWYWAKRRDWF
jgi:hypothetical protein